MGPEGSEAWRLGGSRAAWRFGGVEAPGPTASGPWVIGFDSLRARRLKAWRLGGRERERERQRERKRKRGWTSRQTGQEGRTDKTGRPRPNIYIYIYIYIYFYVDKLVG